MISRLAAWICLPLLLLSGCGYHPVNSAVHMPGEARTLAIPAFRNNTTAYHVSAMFTQAVIREFTDRTSYHVIAGEDSDADATLDGTITSFRVIPLTYDNTTGQTSSYLVTITAQLVMKDKQGKVIWQNPKYMFRQQYEQTQDLASFIQEDTAATRRLARDFAQAAVADVLESF